MKFYHFLFLAAVLLCVSCGGGYGIKENQGDSKGMSSDEVKSQLADIQFLEKFYQLYLSRDSTMETPAMETPAMETQYDSTGAPVIVSSNQQSDPDWTSMVSDSLLSAMEGLDYDIFLSCQDHPDSLDYSITPVVDSPGWYEMNYPSFDGSFVTVRLFLSTRGAQRVISRVQDMTIKR